MYQMTFLGYGISNRSALKLMINKKPGEYFVSENRSIDKEEKEYLIKNNIKFEEKNSTEILKSQAICISPGISPQNELVKKITEKKIPIYTDIEIAARFFPKNIKLIGITGTNGKTTTVELTNKILNSKYKSYACGNIGYSPAELVYTGLINELDFLVIELSSFQLHYFNNINFDTSAILNISEDHLTWHGNYDNYKKDKWKLLNITQKYKIISDLVDIEKHQNCDNLIIVQSSKNYTECYIDIGEKRIIIKIKNQKSEIDLKTIQLKGKHNYYNCAFGGLIGRIYDISENEIQNALNDFQQSEHRIEKFLEKDGITYINDSKSTNADSLIRAIETYEGERKNILLLTGGRGKGEDYTELVKKMEKSCKKVYFCGENIPLILEKIPKNSELKYETYENWDDLIQKVKKEAQKDDIVLFSPGGSSYDFFHDYKERGTYFKNKIKEYCQNP